MTQRAPFLFLVLLLILAGITSAAFRHDTYDIPWLPGAESKIWQVEARVEFIATGQASQVFLTLPPAQSGFETISESAASSGWGFAIEEGLQQRRAHWTARQATGSQVLFYKLDFATTEDVMPATAPETSLNAVLWDEPYQTAVTHLLDIVTPISADAHSMTVQIIEQLKQSAQNVNLLLDQYNKPDLLTRVLNTAGHHARTVQVLQLEDGRRRRSLDTYVQVWSGTEWRLYDPAEGLIQPRQDLLLWQTGEPGVLEVEGGTRSRVSFSAIS